MYALTTRVRGGRQEVKHYPPGTLAEVDMKCEKAKNESAYKMQLRADFFDRLACDELRVRGLGRSATFFRDGPAASHDF
jgi:hypothetical protein